MFLILSSGTVLGIKAFSYQRSAIGDQTCLPEGLIAALAGIVCRQTAPMTLFPFFKILAVSGCLLHQPRPSAFSKTS
jgi:hypothetical protein